MKINKIKFTERYLNFIEKSVDRLPDPFFLFAILALLVILASYIGDMSDLFAIHPGTGQRIDVINLISKENIARMFTDSVVNFVNFPPLGVVLVMVIGIGIADKTGFFKVAIGAFSQFVPPRFIALLFIFLSVNSSVMADSGVVLMPPLGAMVFAGIDRHPLAGLAAGFVGVCGGFSASVVITGLDPLLASLTEPAAKLIDAEYQVFPTANYYFMAFSTFFVTIIINYITNNIVEPRVKDIEVSGTYLNLDRTIEKPDATQRRALLHSLISMIIFTVIILLMTIPESGILRDKAGNLLPFYRSIIFLIMVGFFVAGTVYGISAKVISSGKELVKMSSDMMNTMGGYIVLSFIIAQFIAYFNWSNLGIVTAIKGADFLRDSGFTGVPLVAGFLVFSMVINIFIASASAKWAILSTVFVPMFMLLGMPPEVTQAIYRVGDSVTNFITPMFPYFPIIIVFAREISKEITFGKLVSLLVPYSIALSIIWGIILVLWVLFGIPMGPGVPSSLN
ncbi:MAG: AbgT family transporter [Candidatus Kapabacteria bacterium]|nr:AbgT family transporter [Ignavibacteriota bacterium]MCW5883649.1 AbgT family transporter [Candidatus Kapabacteria bacterium]